MLSRIRNIVRLAYGDVTREDLRDQSIINHPYATATTPDQLIAAHVIESFVKDFKKWTKDGIAYHIPCDLVPLPTYGVRNKKDDTRRRTLRLTGNGLDVRIEWYEWQYRKSLYTRGWWHHEPHHCVVNGQALDPAVGLQIALAYKNIHQSIIAAERTAAEAKAAMEANEAKWNLAEKLLGMRRNADGALVPVEKVVEPPVEKKAAPRKRQTKTRRTGNEIETWLETIDCGEQVIMGERAVA